MFAAVPPSRSAFTFASAPADKSADLEEKSLAQPMIPSDLALTPGTRLGVYDITAQIGEGGIDVSGRARLTPSRDHDAADETRGSAVGIEEAEEFGGRFHEPRRRHPRPARRRPHTRYPLQRRSGSGIVGGRKTPPVSVTSIDPVERRVAAAPAQTISPERAASFVTSGMWLDYGTGLGQPDRVRPRARPPASAKLSNVKIRHCLTHAAARRAGRRSRRATTSTRSACTSPATTGRSTTRDAATTSPSTLARSPTTTGASWRPSDIVVLKTCPVDEHGYFNLSAANLWHRAIVERARTVIVETSRAAALRLRRADRASTSAKWTT